MMEKLVTNWTSCVTCPETVEQLRRQHKHLIHCGAFPDCGTFLLPVCIFSLTDIYCIPGRVLNMAERNKTGYLSGFPHQNSCSGVFPEHKKGVWMQGSHWMTNAYRRTKTWSRSYKMKANILLLKNYSLLEVGAKC